MSCASPADALEWVLEDANRRQNCAESFEPTTTWLDGYSSGCYRLSYRLE